MQPGKATPAAISSETDKSKFVVAAFNGAALYILTYYLVWGLHDAAKFGLSRFFHLRGMWTPSRVVYTMVDNEWWRKAVVTVYGVGPALCLVVGLAAFVWFWRYARAQPGLFKLLLLWLTFHSCNAVFGALLADSFTQSGFYYVPDWLFKMGRVLDYILAGLAGLVQLVLGYFGAVAFLQAHDSRTVMRHFNRKLMVFSTLMVPWVVGGLFISVAKLPYLSIQEVLHLLAMGVLLLPMAAGCLNETFSETVRRALPTNVAWGLVGLAVLAALVWRIALSPPVAFG